MPPPTGKVAREVNSALEPVTVYYWGNGFRDHFVPLRWQRLRPDSVRAWPLALEAGSMVLVDGWISLTRYGLKGHEHWREQLRSWVEAVSRRADLVVATDSLADLPGWLLCSADSFDFLFPIRGQDSARVHGQPFGAVRTFLAVEPEQRLEPGSINRHDLKLCARSVVPWLDVGKVTGYQLPDAGATHAEGAPQLAVVGKSKAPVAPAAPATPAAPAASAAPAAPPRQPAPATVAAVPVQRDVADAARFEVHPPGVQTVFAGNAAPGAAAALEQTAGGEHYDKAMQLRDAGDLEGAIKEFTAAITWKEGVVAHYWRGRCLFDQDKHSHAMPDFDVFIKALAGQRAGPGSLPPTLDGYFYRGMCRLSFKQYEEALEDFKSALRCRPGDPAAIVQQGDCLDGTGALRGGIGRPEPAVAVTTRGRLCALLSVRGGHRHGEGQECGYDGR